MRYEVLLGPNTRQWWVYDNDTDEYIDIPTKILNEVDLYSDDIDKQEKYLFGIVDKNPQWLYDEDYRYKDIEV